MDSITSRIEIARREHAGLVAAAKDLAKRLEQAEKRLQNLDVKVGGTKIMQLSSSTMATMAAAEALLLPPPPQVMHWLDPRNTLYVYCEHACTNAVFISQPSFRLHLSPLIDDARNRFNVDGKRHRDAEAIVATRWLIEVASKVSQGCQHATFFHKRGGGERGGVY